MLFNNQILRVGEGDGLVLTPPLPFLNIRETRRRKPVLPKSISVNSMQNVNFFSLPKLEEEVTKSDSLIKEVERSLEEEKEKRLAEFRTNIARNMIEIKKILTSRRKIREGEKERLKSFFPEVKLVEEAKQTPLTKIIISGGDIFEWILKYIPYQSLITDISLSCWMFHVFVIGRCELYLDIKVDHIKKFPMDDILSKYRKICRLSISIRDRQDQKYRHRSSSHFNRDFEINSQDLIKVSNILENSKSTLVDLRLEVRLSDCFTHRFARWRRDRENALEKKEPEGEVVSETYLKKVISKINLCHRLRNLALPIVPIELEPGLTNRLVSLTFFFDTTLEALREKKFGLDRINWVKNECFQNLRKLELKALSSRSINLIPIENPGGILSGERNQRMDMFSSILQKKVSFESYDRMFGNSGLLGLTKLEVLDFIIFEDYHNRGDFIDFLTRLREVRLRLNHTTSNAVLDKFSSALVTEQEQQQSGRLRNVKIIAVDLLAMEVRKIDQSQQQQQQQPLLLHVGTNASTRRYHNRDPSPLLNFLTLSLEMLIVHSHLKSLMVKNYLNPLKSSHIVQENDIRNVLNFRWEDFIHSIESSSNRNRNIQQRPDHLVWKEKTICKTSAQGVCKAIKVLGIPNITLGVFDQKGAVIESRRYRGSLLGMRREIPKKSQKNELKVVKVVEQLRTIFRECRDHSTLSCLELVIEKNIFEVFGMEDELFIALMCEFLRDVVESEQQTYFRSLRKVIIRPSKTGRKLSYSEMRHLRVLRRINADRLMNPSGTITTPTATHLPVPLPVTPPAIIHRPPTPGEGGIRRLANFLRFGSRIDNNNNNNNDDNNEMEKKEEEEEEKEKKRKEKIEEEFIRLLRKSKERLVRIELPPLFWSIQVEVDEILGRVNGSRIATVNGDGTARTRRTRRTMPNFDEIVGTIVGRDDDIFEGFV